MLSLKDVRTKQRLLQQGIYFHICGISKKDKQNPILFRNALEKHGFIIIELKK